MKFFIIDDCRYHVPNYCDEIPFEYDGYDYCDAFPTYPMRIFVNLGIEPNSNANFPVQMEIESIRVLQKVPDDDFISINDWNDIKGTTATGQNIIIGNSSHTFTLENGNFLTLVATNSITLNPGFEVQKGAIFEADIQEPTSQ